jgi:hypothetical protein
MSELGGSESGDKGAEIPRSSEWQPPRLEDPYRPEEPDDNDRNTLEPEEEGDHGFGELVTEDEFTEPADAPPSLDEQIELELFGRLGDQDDSIDWDELARDLKAFLKTAKDTPFAGNELEDVRDALRDAQEQLADLKGLNDEQAAMIRDLSGRLDRSSEHLGRKDWVIAAIGAGSALVIAGAVPPLFMLHIGVKLFHDIGHLFD